jgi:hypothetical protein
MTFVFLLSTHSIFPPHPQDLNISINFFLSFYSRRYKIFLQSSSIFLFYRSSLHMDIFYGIGLLFFPPSRSARDRKQSNEQLSTTTTATSMIMTPTTKIDTEYDLWQTSLDQFISLPCTQTKGSIQSNVSTINNYYLRDYLISLTISISFFFLLLFLSVSNKTTIFIIKSVPSYLVY